MLNFPKVLYIASAILAILRAGIASKLLAQLMHYGCGYTPFWPSTSTALLLASIINHTA